MVKSRTTQSSLSVRKARSAQDSTKQAHRNLRTVMFERFHEIGKPFPRSSLSVEHFPRLPEELLIEILLCLDARSISACSQTCRTLRRAIANSMLLQYDLALFHCGMLDGPRVDRDHNAQLHRLLAHDAAWRQLKWTNVTSMTHLTGSIHPTAMSGNTVAFIPFGPGLLSGFKLLMQQFPSALRGTEIRQWELQFQLTSVHETLLDSSQDLVVLLDCDPLCVFFCCLYHRFAYVTSHNEQLGTHNSIPRAQHDHRATPSACRKPRLPRSSRWTDDQHWWLGALWRLHRRHGLHVGQIHAPPPVELENRGSQSGCASADTSFGHQTNPQLSRQTSHPRWVPLDERVAAAGSARVRFAPAGPFRGWPDRRSADVPLQHPEKAQTERLLGDPHAPQRDQPPPGARPARGILRQRPQRPAHRDRGGQPPVHGVREARPGPDRVHPSARDAPPHRRLRARARARAAHHDRGRVFLGTVGRGPRAAHEAIRPRAPPADVLARVRPAPRHAPSLRARGRHGRLSRDGLPSGPRARARRVLVVRQTRRRRAARPCGDRGAVAGGGAGHSPEYDRDRDLPGRAAYL